MMKCQSCPIGDPIWCPGMMEAAHCLSIVGSATPRPPRSGCGGCSGAAETFFGPDPETRSPISSHPPGDLLSTRGTEEHLADGRR